MRSRSRTALSAGCVGALAWALARCTVACTSGGVAVPDERPAPAQAGETVTLLLHRYEEGEAAATSGVSLDEAHEIEARVGGCLDRALRKRDSAARFVPADEFRRVVFPGLPFGNAPHSPEALVPLLTHAEFRERAALLRLRYLIVVDGATSQTSESGGGPGPGVGGVVVIWHRESELRAVTLDLAATRALEGPRAQSESEGFFVLLMAGSGAGGVIIPIYKPVGFTRRRACESFGRAVAASLAPPAPGSPSAPDGVKIR